jgi:SAM-dependent methyltransferase
MDDTLNLSSNPRFSFGKNWAKFLSRLDEDKILEAEVSLKEKLGYLNLQNKTFLDIGCGSGLFSLAAYRLGATVYSFDYDEDAVNCAAYLKNKYAPQSSRWDIGQGSILDPIFLEKYAEMDVVYAWGVLHHTGRLYDSFPHVLKLAKKGGTIFISIYNDQGSTSLRWKSIKEKYNKSGYPTKFFILLYTFYRCWTKSLAFSFLTTGNPFKSWIAYGKNNRGMSAWHDLLDWAGGYPFEVAKPEDVFDFFRSMGCELQKLKTCGGIGCNEFVFLKKEKTI